MSADEHRNRFLINIVEAKSTPDGWDSRPYQFYPNVLDKRTADHKKTRRLLSAFFDFRKM